MFFKMNKPKKKAQSILDFILAFGALIFLTAGLVRIWVWFNANFAKSVVDYQNTRLAAGNALANQSAPLNSYDPLDLTENWVFYGTPSGTVGSSSPGYDEASAVEGGGSNGASDVCNQAHATSNILYNQASDMEDEADEIQDYLDLVDDWWEAPLRWILEAMGMDFDDMEDARDDLRNAANDTRNSANQLVSNACSF
jgi:hypothetical protein